MSNRISQKSLAPNQKEIVSESFDKVAEKYLSNRLTPEVIREKERILDLLERGPKYDCVLDLGCGPGTMTEDLLAISNKVWGIDISKEMVKIANARFAENRFKDRVQFKVGNAENLKFPNEYFDAVICIGVLRYVESLQQALEEIYRVLKPGGVTVMVFYHRFSLHWLMLSIYRLFLPLIFFVKGKPLRDCFFSYKASPVPFSWEKFKKVVLQIGFEDLKVRHSGFTFSPFNCLFPNLSTVIYLKLESLLGRSQFLGWIGSICIVKAKRLQ